MDSFRNRPLIQNIFNNQIAKQCSACFASMNPEKGGFTIYGLFGTTLKNFGLVDYLSMLIMLPSYPWFSVEKNKIVVY